jgi:hypothetical protein
MSNRRQERKEAKSRRKTLKDNATFKSIVLHVMVAGESVYRYDALSSREPEMLGPVKGAHAEVYGNRRSWVLNNGRLMANTIVTLANGKSVKNQITDRMYIRRAEADAMVFNTMAAAITAL